MFVDYSPSGRRVAGLISSSSPTWRRAPMVRDLLTEQGGLSGARWPGDEQRRGVAGGVGAQGFVRCGQGSELRSDLVPAAGFRMRRWDAVDAEDGAEGEGPVQRLRHHLLGADQHLRGIQHRRRYRYQRSAPPPPIEFLKF